MNLYNLLVRKGIKPELVLAMRHAVSRKQFWPQSNRKVFEDYQRGLGQGQKTMLNNKKYIASFVGHESRKALFVAWTVSAQLDVCQLIPSTVCQKLRSYSALECLVAKARDTTLMN